MEKNAQVFDQMLYILKRFMVLPLVKLKLYETVSWTLVSQNHFLTKEIEPSSRWFCPIFRQTVLSFKDINIMLESIKQFA